VAANATRAAYLFQPDKLHGERDLGDRSLQCGRRADGFKLWLAWKALGDAGFEARVDRCFELAAHAAGAVRRSGGALVLVAPPACTNVCFWVVPPALRPFDPDTATPEALEALGRVAPAVKRRMQAAGDALVGYQPLGPRKPNFFRLVFADGRGLSEATLDALLGRMVACAAALPPEELRPAPRPPADGA